MSSSHDIGRIELRDPMGLTEFVVRDGRLDEIGRGLGDLDLTGLKPGLYQIERRAGADVDQYVVSLEPGETAYGEGLHLPAAAPVLGTSTTRETHHFPLVDASERLAGMAGYPSGVVLSVRNVNATSGGAGSAASQLSLLDPQFQEVALDPWEVNEDDDLAVRIGRLPPGPYTIRTRRHPTKVQRSAGTTVEVFDQPLWLSAGWQTLVFIPIRSRGASTELASVQMGRLDVGWTTGSDSEQVQLAVEQAYTSLRSGEPMPEGALRMLLEREELNAMFSILGAHLLLMSAKRDLNFVAHIVDYLRGIAGPSPDADALAAMIRLVDPSHPIPVDPVTSPPMLADAYEAAVAYDAVERIIHSDSLTARLAPYRQRRGLWTSWAPIDEQATQDHALKRRAARKRTRSGVTRSGARSGGVYDLDALAEFSAETADEAAAQVASALVEQAEFQPDFGGEPDVAHVSRATGLPTSLVEKSLEKLKDLD